MKTYYQPGDKLTIYSEPLLGRVWLWLRQFPKPVVCFAIFASGMVFCHLAKHWGHIEAPKKTAQHQSPGTKESALAILPLPEILKPSEPFVLSEFVPADDTERAAKAFIERFAPVAVEEMKRFGIPASVKLAQGLNESDAGRSELATKANNYFGVKCFSRTCKKGHCTNFGDDSHKDFFRKYGSAWQSWRSHSKMIVSGKFKVLLKHGNDYEAWAKGLKKLGYATSKTYDVDLIEIIEKYHLQDFDK